VLPTGRVMAFADPVRTRQIIRNLLSNAVCYGGDNITVAASNGLALLRSRHKAP